MKTIPALVFAAAFAAVILFPVTFEAAVSLLVVGGVTTIMFADYSRKYRQLAIRVAPLPAVIAPGNERLGLAA
jgi:hypothetical protein